MAYIIQSFKNEYSKRKLKNHAMRSEDKTFIFIVILSAIVITIDYILVIKFIDILKNF